MKKIVIYMLAVAALAGATSCEGFLDTAPHDALSPSTTWRTETDAQKFLIGCYDGWFSDDDLLYWDCASDFGYNFHIHEGWRNIGNGGMTASNAVADFYRFTTIRRCNDFLTNIEPIQFADEKVKNDMIGQVKTIRAYQYYERNRLYGGFPIIDSYATADEAKVPRKSEEEVKKYVFDEIDAAIPLLSDKPASSGTIAKGTALALKMRSALYYGDYQRTIDAAKAIVALGQYELDENYAHIFTVAGKGSKEIIASYQRDKSLYSQWVIGAMYNNADGGWSSMVPTQNLVDTYEMSNGLTKDEAGSGYDPKHPFANRDPRMAMTVLYPGMDWQGGILNTLDKTIGGNKNPNDPDDANNASKTALTWAKYLAPKSQYDNMWSTDVSVILFRYAEVLLSYAEAENELNGPSETVYTLLNQVRNRAGMPEVNKGKYGTKETLRELIRRERGVELAGEGIRRADILRWKDASGKMVAETVLNGPLTRVAGTLNYQEPDPFKRAVVTGTSKVEDREFKTHNKYLPIPQGALDKNPELKQNPGY